MTAFNIVGAFLAGLLAFSVALYATVVGAVLGHHKTREAFRHFRDKRARLAAGLPAGRTEGLLEPRLAGSAPTPAVPAARRT